MGLIKKPKKYNASLTNEKGDYLPDGLMERDLYNVQKMMMWVMLKPTKENITGLEKMFLKIREKAIEGDKFYVKMVMEYLYGKPTEKHFHFNQNQNVEVPKIVFIDELKERVIVNRRPSHAYSKKHLDELDDIFNTIDAEVEDADKQDGDRNNFGSDGG
ncbi:MAG: hypothetical protein QXT25_03320 [Candidatus Anstonellaceae archaeon]